MATSQRPSMRRRIVEELFFCCAFWLAMSALPALALSYAVVRASKHMWLKILSSRYPDLEFIKTDTVRSLLDTHRNQGIINVLLCVKGSPDVEDIKQNLLHHVIDRRDNNGDLMFPRLRHLLVSCWGNYAWNAGVLFNPENHIVLMSNATYRGRPVSGANIQEYISETISKYFPSDQQPWQYIIIPCISPEPKYYVLVRVHHLLLSGKKSLNIGDMLMIEQAKLNKIGVTSEYTQLSPLAKLYPNTSAIPELWGRINENLSNTWNEFISEYDPVESPRALKSLPGAFHVAGLLIISGATAVRELSKKRTYSGDSRTEPVATATSFLLTVKRECKRRNLTAFKILISPLITIDPRRWPRLAFNAALTSTKLFLTFPFRFCDEIRALLELKRTGQVRYPNTFTWKYGELVQLLIKALGEAWRFLVEVYRAPAKLWTDAIAQDDYKRNLLQTVSLCGRKVAAWSKPVPRANIERAARALGVSSTDIGLYATTEALRSFFEQSRAESPDIILMTARSAPEDFLFTFAEGYGKDYKKSHTGGMICLSVPVGATPRRVASVIENACNRQAALASAWAAQARYGALTRAIPYPLAKMTLNLLSRKYAVSFTEITAPIDSRKRTTLWGQELDYVVYWRPPQANISMSLTVIQYADSVRLSVMTDARLSPAHMVPAVRWATSIEQLVARIDQEIARISARASNIPHIVTTHPTNEDEVESELATSLSECNLRPPTTTVASPPPSRRLMTQY